MRWPSCSAYLMSSASQLADALDVGLVKLPRDAKGQRSQNRGLVRGASTPSMSKVGSASA